MAYVTGIICCVNVTNSLFALVDIVCVTKCCCCKKYYFTMSKCPHCHRTFKGLKNHLSQGICRSFNKSVTTRASVPVASIPPNLPSVRERESSYYSNPSNVMHEDTHIEKRIRHTETCLDIGSEKDILCNSHDDLSLHCPDSIVNRLLDAQFELDVIPERDEVDEMFQFDIESESDADDNSSACIVDAVDDNIDTPAITNVIDVTNEYVVAPDVRQVVGIEKPKVSRADRLLICLSALCADANVPLYLVDDIVEIILDEMDRGLILNSSEFSKWRSFL